MFFNVGDLVTVADNFLTVQTVLSFTTSASYGVHSGAQIRAIMRKGDIGIVLDISERDHSRLLVLGPGGLGQVASARLKKVATGD